MLNIGSDLIISSYKNGAKFWATKGVLESNSLTSISNPMLPPCNLFILNKRSECLSANQYMIDCLELDSAKEVIGKTVLDFCKDEQSLNVIKNDRQVIEQEKILLVDEIRVNKEDLKEHYLSVKIPLYSNTNNVEGILGFSILLGQQPLAESLILLSEMGLPNLFDPTRQKFSLQTKQVIDGISFTDRQWSIINLIVRGFSAAKIGQELGLSKRTVEHYIDIIKNKLFVSSKSDLIDKILEANKHSE